MGWLVLLVLAAPRDVYYSAGQNTLDHKTDSTGSLRVVLSGGAAAFSEPQLAPNLGVGDVLDYDVDNKQAFLAAKLDATLWKVTTNRGDVPPDTAPVIVNSIHHAFGSVFDAFSNGQAAALLGTSDLADAGIALHVACYFDTGPELVTNAVYIAGWATSPQTYVHLFAPIRDCNTPQRHPGVWDDTKPALIQTSTYNLLDIYALDVRLEGLQLGLQPPDGTTFADAIDLRTAGHFDVFDNVIHGVFAGTSGADRGIEVEGGQPAYGPDYGDAGVTRLWNNVLYGFVNGTNDMHTVEHDFGAIDTLLMFNNTVVHNDNGLIDQAFGSSLLNNNLFIDNLAFLPGANTSGCNNVFGPASEPNALPCASTNAATVTFAGPNDFHLRSPLDGGLNLGPPYDVDIDGDARPAAGAWDIGADQFVAPGADAGADGGLDAGPAPPPDGGPTPNDAGVANSDGGSGDDGGTGARSFRTSCGCDAAPGLWLSVLWAAAARRASRARAGRRPPSAG